MKIKAGKLPTAYKSLQVTLFNHLLFGKAAQCFRRRYVNLNLLVQSTLESLLSLVFCCFINRKISNQGSKGSVMAHLFILANHLSYIIQDLHAMSFRIKSTITATIMANIYQRCSKKESWFGQNVFICFSLFRDKSGDSEKFFTTLAPC